MTDLLDLIADDTDPGYVHVVMPTMAYVCGGCLCGCRGPKGTWVLGVREWAKVTCPECLAPGRDAVAAEVTRQQRHGAA